MTGKKIKEETSRCSIQVPKKIFLEAERFAIKNNLQTEAGIKNFMHSIIIAIVNGNLVARKRDCDEKIVINKSKKQNDE